MPPLGGNQLRTPTTITCAYPVSVSPSSFSTVPCDASCHKQAESQSYFSSALFLDDVNTPMPGVYSQRGIIVRTTSPLDDASDDHVTHHSFHQHTLLQQEYFSSSEASNKPQHPGSTLNSDRNSAGPRRSTQNQHSHTWDWIELFTACPCLPEDTCRSQNIPMENFEDEQRSNIRINPNNSCHDYNQNDQSPRSVACKSIHPIINQPTQQPVATAVATQQQHYQQQHQQQQQRRRRRHHIVYPIAKYPDALNSPSLVEKRRKSLRHYWNFQPVVAA